MALSNFLQAADVGDGGAVECRIASPQEILDALALVLGSPAAPADAGQINEFLAFAAQRRIAIDHMWVIGAAGQLGWAVLPIVSPGRTMLLLTPATRPPELDVGPIIAGVCEHFAGRGVHLAQALADPLDSIGRQLYAAQGFREMAELLYLHTPLRRTAQPRLPGGFEWQAYSAPSHGLFAQAIMDSYQQSLDCPALNGMRTVEDIIAGHQASGQFDPRFWLVLLEKQAPVGTVLLNRVPRSDAAELVYFGLAPAWRGRGLGELMLRHALWAARQMGVARLTLAVDARNAPALKLYYRHGMQRMGSKIALMRDLRQTPGPA